MKKIGTIFIHLILGLFISPMVLLLLLALLAQLLIGYIISGTSKVIELFYTGLSKAVERLIKR